MVKLIKHTGECDHQDDPSMPFKLELVMRAPEFMNVAFVLLYGGTEDVVARADTQEELSRWIVEKELKTHPRVIRYSIADKDGKVVESFDRHARTGT